MTDTPGNTPADTGDTGAATSDGSAQPAGPIYGPRVASFDPKTVASLSDEQRNALVETYARRGYDPRGIRAALTPPGAPGAPAQKAPIRDDLKAGAGTVLPPHQLHSAAEKLREASINWSPEDRAELESYLTGVGAEPQVETRTAQQIAFDRATGVPDFASEYKIDLSPVIDNINARSPDGRADPKYLQGVLNDWPNELKIAGFSQHSASSFVETAIRTMNEVSRRSSSPEELALYTRTEAAKLDRMSSVSDVASGREDLQRGLQSFSPKMQEALKRLLHSADLTTALIQHGRQIAARPKGPSK